MIRQCFPFLADEPPVLVDWLPWNHTFGGNHNIGITLYNGGTLYIDDGKPTPALIGETLRNLREIAPTIYFNVPKGFEEIANALESRRGAARDLLQPRARCSSSPAPACRSRSGTSSTRVAEADLGERIRMLTGLGMTETAPFAICANAPRGEVGPHRPAGARRRGQAGADAAARPRCATAARTSRRATGARPSRRREAFDEEGFYCTGDAVQADRPARPAARLRVRRPHRRGLQARRPAPSSASARCARRSSPPATRCVQDVVVTGINRDEVGVAGLPAPRRVPRAAPACRRRAGAARCCASAAGARVLPAPGRRAARAAAPAARTASRARSCWPSRRRSTRARSPTRARSTSAPC